GGIVDPYVKVAMGDTHSCAIRQSGALACWGDNGAGELGDGSNTNRLVPTTIGTDTWSAVSAGQEFTCAIRSDTTLWCWGSNDAGRLGSAGGDINKPRQVTLGTGTETGWTWITNG